MLRTALAAALLVCAGYVGASWLTHDFQVWTAEGARRLEVALQPVPVPEVHIEGPGLPAQPLARWLAASGRVTVVDFIYTRCETLCLSLGGVFQQMQRSLQQDGTPAGEGVRLLSISFDGVHDTPDRLAAYARGLGADPALWQFVRVPEAHESAALLRRLQVVVVPDGRGDYEHNAALLVLDAAGRLVRVFDVSEQELALNYARHLAAKGGA
ncbi:MAG: SCO family protein [Giesbergeria sp.]